MNTKDSARYIGIFLLLVGAGGLVLGEQRLWDVMNINLGLDVVRLMLGLMLLSTGLNSSRAAQGGFALFGLAYLGAFFLGMFSPTLFGLLPDGLGIVDQVLHLGGGLLGMALGMPIAGVVQTRKV